MAGDFGTHRAGSAAGAAPRGGGLPHLARAVTRLWNRAAMAAFGETCRRRRHVAASLTVKGFGCRPRPAVPRTPAAGVRKPPGEETAMGERIAVPRHLWGFDCAVKVACKAS